jgi:hypothetical protein
LSQPLNAAANQLADSGTFMSGNLDSKNLKEESFLEFAMWYASFFQMVQATDYLYRQGSLDRSLWETEVGRAAMLLSLPGVRQLWDAGLKTQLAPEFVALVESRPPTMKVFNWSRAQGFHELEAGSGTRGEEGRDLHRPGVGDA